MENKKYILKSFSQVTFVNLFSMLVTAILTLIVPRYIDPLNYGLWQLFVFYQGYLGFFHFGWNDGIYLRYGGYDYSHLKKEIFSPQFWSQIFFEFIIGIIILLFFATREPEITRKYIIWQLVVNLVILNSRYMLIYLLQATARIKEYAGVLWLDRFSYIFIILLLVFTKKIDYRSLILAETYSKIAAYLLAIYYCKDLVFNRVFEWSASFREVKKNITVGYKVLFANIASILIMGVCRIGIEKNWGVKVFGEVSLTITFSQLFITFVTNVGMILFPILKKMDTARLVQTFSSLKNGITILIFFILVWYFPGSLLLKKWIPAYTNSIKYMGLLLPVCFYESKMALLNSTYLKALREEKRLMIINGWTMVLSVLLSSLFSFALKNLILSILSITILIAFRCIWSEKKVSDSLNISCHVFLNKDNSMMLAFIILNYFIGGWLGFIIYVVLFIIYILKYFCNNKMRILKNII